ncbi:MAG: hypothetical protein ACO331_05190 [Prochlorothrix sp.]
MVAQCWYRSPWFCTAIGRVKPPVVAPVWVPRRSAKEGRPKKVSKKGSAQGHDPYQTQQTRSPRHRLDRVTVEYTNITRLIYIEFY